MDMLCQSRATRHLLWRLRRSWVSRSISNKRQVRAPKRQSTWWRLTHLANSHQSCRALAAIMLQITSATTMSAQYSLPITRIRIVWVDKLKWRAKWKLGRTLASGHPSRLMVSQAQFACLTELQSTRRHIIQIVSKGRTGLPSATT